jgi:hypothetical protein
MGGKGARKAKNHHPALRAKEDPHGQPKPSQHVAAVQGVINTASALVSPRPIHVNRLLLRVKLPQKNPCLTVAFPLFLDRIEPAANLATLVAVVRWVSRML